MKDATLTIRVPASLRHRLQTLAHQEGRSLSQQAGRLIERGLGAAAPPGSRGARDLSGALSGGNVPTLADFRAARGLVTEALRARTRADDNRRR